MLSRAAGRFRLAPLRHFTPALEREFGGAYYDRVKSSLRLVAPFMVALLYLGLQLAKQTPAPYDLTIAIPQMEFWFVVFVVTWGRLYVRVWQPLIVGLALVASALVLLPLPHDIGDLMTAAATSGSDAGASNLAQQKFYFALQIVVLLVPFAMLRLQFLWSLVLYLGVIGLGVLSFVRGFAQAPNVLLDVHHAFLPVFLVFSSLMLTAFLQERLSRTAFWNAHQLEEERNAERKMREQTEGKLQVLSQAIGGIVHDLGNPLASVQLGSQTLELFLGDEVPDKVMLEELNQTITEGARMLDFLRLSLIEQTRVLEGKPTPIDPKPVSLRALLQSGVRFQKPYVVGTRSVYVSDGDLTLCADELKMVTVWMNLIGNAFKYSDGDVRVRWREHECPQGKYALVGVVDIGTKGKGLSRANAAKLFAAFGRLDDHSQIEGTGLGLLSVRKIMEAHGGTAWIEGYEDGTTNSSRYSTCPDNFPPLLEGSDRTAFVVSCPLVTKDSEKREDVADTILANN